jgi:hypothetical protein
MSDESSGWGRDFDDDGNVIGEVPEQETDSMLPQHWKKILAVASVWLVINVVGRRLELSLEGAIGAVVGSLIVSTVLVYTYVYLFG